MTDALLPANLNAKRLSEQNYFRKGKSIAQTGRSKLQNQRAILNQQILKAMRMRAGAENLLRATANNKIREQVLLELSFVNSNLQRLKEELERLNISVEVYQHTEQASNIPLIPLGLKETKDVDFTTAFKDFILEHYSEDASEYENELADLMDLRQACRTPSRDEAGVELLVSYFQQLGYLENRFFPPSRNIGILFTWYDSFTGVPVSQPNISLEKASILFNIAALYSQIGTRCNRQTKIGLEEAVTTFQKAAGVLNYLKETFTHTPSYDMSPAMLGALIKMLLAEAHECYFEKMILSGIQNEFCTLLKAAQEAAKVSEVHMQVYTLMNQAPIKENVPYSWSVMVQVKAEHYKALANYFVAITLIDYQLNLSDDEDKQEKAISQLYDSMPEGLTAQTILKDQQQRTLLGKAHLSKAIRSHEEAIRFSTLCSTLRQIDVLQLILSAFHQRSLLKFSQHQKPDDFLDLLSAPDIVSKTEYQAETIPPQLSKDKVTDIFQRLGPLSIFSVKQRWSAPRKMCITKEDGDFGFVLKGDCPVQVISLDPLCPAATEGLKEGDYIVSVAGKDCKWCSTSQVMDMLQETGQDSIEIQVISIQDQTNSLANKSATYYAGMQKTYSLVCLTMDNDKNTKTQKATKKLSFLSWGFKNRQKAASTICLPSEVKGKPKTDMVFSFPDNSLSTESALY
ncbi:rhophilin-2-B [Xenopus laevis]|uniref:Rhophilin-2-B n=1 Tax=Xenopus laevis TaxID=8355 RepID=RHN2B_XENLA|nr:rhophilin-2-B [Xenopus laevis]Q63ZR5.1 RecName: Full=Rhophilin-2-B; AltName: Full=GTP-Rho-binding protein 2-B [Xenopus laevis]AAH82845.1 Rhpn2-b protein [Xenopus laevis]